MPDNQAITAEVIAKSVHQSNDANSIQVSATATSQPRRHVDPETASLWYGEGFHAYWEGNYEEALENLNSSVEASDLDARAWYYKGFTEIALDKEKDAIQSLANAVRVELSDRAQSKKISKSLERIQGSLRLRIQKAKVQARTMKPGDSTADERLANKS